MRKGSRVAHPGAFSFCAQVVGAAILSPTLQLEPTVEMILGRLFGDTEATVM
jgi:hypothetical protein